MRRLFVLPATVGFVAVGCGWVWWSGLAWPLLTQTWAVLAPRRATEHTEADYLA